MKSLRARMMHFIRRWHARIGVLAALFFLFLSVTGVALNHTDALHLAKTEVQARWLMRWYGLKPDIPTHGYVFKNGYFAASDDRWVLNGNVLPMSDRSLLQQVPVGAVAWTDMLAIAGSRDLFLYRHDGQQVDHMSAAMLPGVPVRRLGTLTEGAISKLVLKTADGEFVSEDGLAWKALDVEETKPLTDIVWAQQQALPQNLSASLLESFSPSLPLERIVLDVHSGRILGTYGPLLMDFVALVLVTLSLSGMWIYVRSARKRPKR